MRAKKIEKTHQKIFLISVAILFIAVYGVLLLGKYNNGPDYSKYSIPDTRLTTYESEFLGFKFNIRHGFQIIENGNTIRIVKSDSHINITRLFSYTNSFKEYFSDLAEKNHLNVTYTNKNSNGFNILNVTYGVNKNDELVYIKNIDEGTFVSISTSSPDLYDDVENIAASFEYTK